MWVVMGFAIVSWALLVVVLGMCSANLAAQEGEEE